MRPLAAAGIDAALGRVDPSSKAAATGWVRPQTPRSRYSLDGTAPTS